mmetsp:Transcript_24306/g.30920  ORF Transcript_24306/g.30920 Transcript_24306/m.30920 type:complete len:162 (-) Transcript_24306:386-871(-)
MSQLVHKHERRHHYVIRTPTGTKHVVVKELEIPTDTPRDKTKSPRKHSAPAERKSNQPMSVKSKGRLKSCNLPSEGQRPHRPRRTVSEGSQTSWSPRDVHHHHHHHHHYHKEKSKPFDALRESRRRLCPEKLSNEEGTSIPKVKKRNTVSTIAKKIISIFI